MAKDYALYKGNELLSIGTISEIAKQLNVKNQLYIFIRQNHMNVD